MSSLTSAHLEDEIQGRSSCIYLGLGAGGKGARETGIPGVGQKELVGCEATVVTDWKTYQHRSSLTSQFCLEPVLRNKHDIVDIWF